MIPPPPGNQATAEREAALRPRVVVAVDPGGLHRGPVVITIHHSPRGPSYELGWGGGPPPAAVAAMVAALVQRRRA